MLRYYAIALALLANPAPSAASEVPDAAVAIESDLGVIGASPSKWRIGMALGYGVRTNPLIQSEDIPIVVDLDIAWFGERFFFDNGDLGLTMTDNEWLTLSAITRINSDRVFFGRTDTRFVRLNAGTAQQLDVEVTVPDRDYALELGAEILTDGNWGQLQFAAFHDVSGTHGGYEVSASYTFGVRRQRWYLEPSIGASYKSDKLNSYYWGVEPEESSPALPAYEPGSGTNVELRLMGNYQLTPYWTLSVVAEVERMNDPAAASPIVSDDYVYGFFAGFGYRF